MKILIDVDGVVADLDREWLRRYNQDYNDHLTKKEWTKWGIHDLVKPECGTKIYEYLWMDDLYNNVLPIEGSLFSVRHLRSMGHRCIFVTSGIQPAKIRWLFNQGFLTSKVWQSDPDVAIVNDKSLIHGDLLIDDRPKNIDDFGGNAILFDQPWNQEYNLVYRAKYWNDVLAQINLETA